MPLDLRDGDFLDRLGAAPHARWRKLDVLVANAGTLGLLMPLAHLDPAAWHDLVAVNVTANLRLIRSLDPLLRAYWGPYVITKGAVDSMARTYAAETASTPLRTRMRAEAMPGEDPETPRTAAEPAPRILDLCLPAWDRTGCLYDVPSDAAPTFQAPA